MRTLSQAVTSWSDDTRALGGPIANGFWRHGVCFVQSASSIQHFPEMNIPSINHICYVWYINYYLLLRFRSSGNEKVAINKTSVAKELPRY
jgi:hypothetical protein